MLGTLEEIIESLLRHPLRLMIIAIGVSWGVFILIVLLGIGRGIETGILSQLEQYSINTLWFLGGLNNNLGSEGNSSQVKFDPDHLELAKRRFPDIIGLTPEPQPSMINVKQGEYSGTHLLKGVYPDYFSMKSLTLDHGRELNFHDGLNHELVVVLGSQVKELIFDQDPAVGQYINLSNYHFLVVGVLKSGSLSNQYESNSIFVHHKTLISYFNQGSTFSKIGVQLQEHIDPLAIGDDIEALLRRTIGLRDGKDEAVHRFSSLEQAEAFHGVFRALRYFIWMIGICLIIGSIIGVANTVLMSINSRMKEITLRKAVGATPNAIASLIVGETCFIVLLSGALGIILGLMANKVLALGLKQYDQQRFESFSNFQVSPGAVALCLFMLIASGILAGLIPALKAANLKPAEIITRK